MSTKITSSKQSNSMPAANSRGRQSLWFIALYLGGVAVITGASYALRLLIP